MSDTGNARIGGLGNNTVLGKPCDILVPPSPEPIRKPTKPPAKSYPPPPRRPNVYSRQPAAGASSKAAGKKSTTPPEVKPKITPDTSTGTASSSKPTTGGISKKRKADELPSGRSLLSRIIGGDEEESAEDIARRFEAKYNPMSFESYTRVAKPKPIPGPSGKANAATSTASRGRPLKRRVDSSSPDFGLDLVFTPSPPGVPLLRQEEDCIDKRMMGFEVSPIQSLVDAMEAEKQEAAEREKQAVALCMESILQQNEDLQKSNATLNILLTEALDKNTADASKLKDRERTINRLYSAGQIKDIRNYKLRQAIKGTHPALARLRDYDFGMPRDGVEELGEREVARWVAIKEEVAKERADNEA
ncbi:uncharacterized protein MKK02DRAFT_42213 [Dioszegia hungarica]|uniref:Uncharacterized protein n=1 Tax=Dioszegia hungarica TaxID=4972 RepID=A0AA38HFA1_9TREE|nr:uncharacterized protein MKK02DRAFT_42213 [Dioszegia hungarica]KAI9637839.1 hypothetical protein MKK02DRAFT_42213 [Dioszegia hungarica]